MLKDVRELKDLRWWAATVILGALVWAVGTWINPVLPLDSLDRVWTVRVALVIAVAMLLSLPLVVVMSIRMWQERDPETTDFFATIGVITAITIVAIASAPLPATLPALVLARWFLNGSLLFCWGCFLVGCCIGLARGVRGRSVSGPIDDAPFAGAPIPTLPLERVVETVRVHGKLHDGTAVSRLRRLAPYEFERWVAEQLRRLGYTVEERGGQSDHGIDLLARRGSQTLVVQCKKFITRKVGEPDLRDLTGVLMREQVDAALMITTNEFTREAMTWLEASPGHLRAKFDLWDAFMCDALAEENDFGPAPTPLPFKLEHCPRCNGWLVRRHSWRGWFIGCSNYGPQNCRFAKHLPTKSHPDPFVAAAPHQRDT